MFESQLRFDFCQKPEKHGSVSSGSCTIGITGVNVGGVVQKLWTISFMQGQQY